MLIQHVERYYYDLAKLVKVNKFWFHDLLQLHKSHQKFVKNLFQKDIELKQYDSPMVQQYKNLSNKGRKSKKIEGKVKEKKTLIRFDSSPKTNFSDSLIKRSFP